MGNGFRHKRFVGKSISGDTVMQLEARKEIEDYHGYTRLIMVKKRRKRELPEMHEELHGFCNT